MPGEIQWNTEAVMDEVQELVRVGARELAREATRKGIDVGGMCLQPTANQRCYKCGGHHGWVCVCSREERSTAWEIREAKMQTPWFAGKWDSANPSDREVANQSSLQTLTANLCECGRPKRPKGTDCWRCYRARGKG